MTTFAQYCRAERAAGGVGCTTREFIRGCYTLLNDDARTRAKRDQRHQWLRNMLAERAAARKMAGCSLGVGCDETGFCYADAHGEPNQCGRR